MKPRKLIGSSRHIPPVHPVLFGIYPALALFAANTGQLPLSDGYRTLVFSIALSLIIYSGMRLIAGNWDWAALSSTMILLMFFTYGHVYNQLKGVEVLGLNVARHRYLVPVWLGLLLAGWRVIRWLRDKAADPKSINRPLTAISAILLVVPVYSILIFASQISDLEQPLDMGVSAESTLNPSPDLPLPDLYYIILDGYGRSDALYDKYGYDNSAFIGALERMGFSIADASQSNYAQTELSLASSLNMDYLPNLSEEVQPDSDDKSDLWRLIRHSRVRRLLEGIGYHTVAYETGFYWTQLSDADHYLSRFDNSENSLTLTGLNPFENMFFRTTAGKFVIDTLTQLSSKLSEPGTFAAEHRERVLYILDTLDNIRLIEGPKFIFVHIVIPHAPFVFGPNGENLIPSGDFTLQDTALSDEQYIEGYVNQVIFIDSQIEPILERILERSSRPSIIVLQADHGPGRLDVRMPILNALHMPEETQVQRPATTTPVNTFRYIFNRYFGADFDILEDVSYISSYNAPYDFTIVPNPAAQ